MKRKITFLLAALLLMSGLTWAQMRTEEVTYTLDGNIAGGTNGYATESEITQNGITWMVTGNTTMTPWRIGGKNLTNVDRPLYSTNAISDNITKVVVTNGTATLTVNSMTLIVSANADFSNPTSTISGTWAASSTTTFERPADADWSNMYFKLVYNVTAGSSNQYAQFIKGEFYKEMDASAPSIDADDVEIAYDATSGVIEYNINNPAGGTLTANTTAEWLTLGTVGTTVPFTCTANPTGVARTATVVLTYTYNTDQTVTKNVMVTQAANPNAVDNISDITATGTYTVQGTIVAKSTRGFIVGDGTGYVYYYNTNYTQADYNIGDMVKLSGSVVVYGGVYEFNASTTVTAATSSNYVAEDPTVLSGADMDARVGSTTPPDLSNYVQYEGTLSVNESHYNITNIAGATTAIGSISYPLNVQEITALNGKQVKVTGYYVGISTSTYYNTMLGTIEEIVSNDPSIVAEDVSVEYDATSGAIAFTINNPVSGGVLTAATESEWLALGTVGTTVPFTCAANATASPRTATVTLTYTYNRATATANVTVTQAGNPNIVDNISDITAAGTYTVQGTIVAISNRGFILGDGTGYVYYYYGSGFEYDNYDIGDNVKLSGPVVVFGGVFEFNNSTEIIYVEESNYMPESPIVLTGAEMDARVASTTPPQLSTYVQYEGILAISGSGDNIHYNITNIAGATTAKGSISYPLNVEEITALDGKYVLVTGYYVGISSSQYYNTMIGSVYINEAITFDTYEVDVPAEGAEGTLNATYHNMEGFEIGDYFDVYFYAEDGVTHASYDWITAELDADNNVHYVVQANQGAARTAYFKVGDGYEFGGGDPLDGGRDAIAPVAIGVYSNLVTVSQEAYVAPTYAELPFSFNGGRDDIETTDGLYQEGLGTDYSATTAPNTQLKFDNTGDWLLLQFAERPGTLTFNIKNNSFSGGTFTVQTSEDGVTYTDLATYTEITGTQEEEFANLGENVRYIKWVYTERVNGNVGLGNIVLNEYTEPVPTILLDTYAIDVPAEGGEGTIDVTYQNLEVSAEYLGVVFYDENGEPCTYDWISVVIDENYNVHYVVEANQGDARTAYFKVNYSYFEPGESDIKSLRDGLWDPDYYSDLVTVSQAAYVPPFEPATYTLATTIESGKTYIIVGSKTINDETHYYAMGEQRPNNRAGVAISVDGTTATVENAEVHEFIINETAMIGPDPEFKGGGGAWSTADYYTIYDTNEASQGYLYAASSSGNQLKTETEIDENGIWDIAIDETGQFTIVAQGSNTRNVMQFNYNNNNPTIFSCYETASQLPVYLYVKDEPVTTVTQTIALSAGANWVSFNVDITLDDLEAALLAALPDAPSGSIEIKSKNNGSVKYQSNRWRGTLASLDMAQSYRIKVGSDCEITLEGMPIDPTQLVITIKSGANWIPFPFSTGMTVADAFAGFAVGNDQVKSKNNGDTKYQGSRWRGNLTTLVPGQGYIYNSASSEDRPFVYPVESKAAK